MSLHAIATVGLRTIQQLAPLQNFHFYHDQNGLAVTEKLLSISLPGAPVVDASGRYIGFISQFDVLSVLEAGRDVSQLTAEDIMVQDHVAIQSSTTLSEAVKLMKGKHFLVLPVEQDGVLIGCLSRQDLLRVWIDVGLLGILTKLQEKNPHPCLFPCLHSSGAPVGDRRERKRPSKPLY